MLGTVSQLSASVRAYQVFSNKLVSMIQQGQGTSVLGTQAAMTPVNAGQDDLAAHVEALLAWQGCLFSQLCCLDQDIGCQDLHPSMTLHFALSDTTFCAVILAICPTDCPGWYW